MQTEHHQEVEGEEEVLTLREEGVGVEEEVEEQLHEYQDQHLPR